MSYAFLFPGQGAQFVGMGHDLYQHCAAVRELFALASDVADRDMAQCIFRGSEQELKQTDNTQIAVTLVNLAAQLVLAEYGITSSYSGGFSVGEYAALVDANVLSARDALWLVYQRGRIMEEASRRLDDANGSSGMAAVIGLDLSEVQDALVNIKDVYPSLYNSPVQTVIGGTASALSAAEEALKKAGARRLVPLKVSGPFHTPLMQDAKEKFAEVAASAQFSNPSKNLYSNVHGKQVHTGEDIRSLCVEQLVSTVLWTVEEQNIAEDGGKRLLEVGPGTVLQGLWNAFIKHKSDWNTIVWYPAGTLQDIQQCAEEGHS